MPVILDKINRTLSDESIKDLKDAIEWSAKDFINDRGNRQQSLETAAAFYKNRIEN
jgi:hypothetical protein